MAPLIDTKQFENIFKADVLKRGLSLCKNGNVALIEKNVNNTYKFLVNDKAEFEINLTKKAQKITDYNCTCNNLNDKCKHLCAVLFYLEKDSLGIEIKISTGSTNKVLVNKTTIKKEKSQTFKDFLYGVEYTQLLDFIAIESKKNELLKLQITSHFTLVTNQTAFEDFSNKLKIILWNYLEYGKLYQKNINEIVEQINTLNADVKNLTTNYNNLFFYNLALVCELPKLFKVRTSANDSALYTRLNEAIIYLNSYILRSLNTFEIEALKNSALQIIKNNKFFNVDFSSYILKKSINFIDVPVELLKLKTALFKLKNTVFYSSDINKIEILKQYITIKHSKLSNLPFIKSEQTTTIEFILANAEILINDGKNVSAFLIIEKSINELILNGDGKIISILNYSLLFAKNYNNKSLQIKCLQNLFIYDFFVRIEYIEQLKELISQTDFNIFIEKILIDLNNSNQKNWFEKKIYLLNYCNRLTDIINELKNQHDKFDLLNNIALKNLPTYSIELLDVYLIHFLRALQDARYDFLQETIFKTAKKYIDKLPVNAQNYLLETIFKKIHKSKTIYRIIKSFYPLKN